MMNRAEFINRSAQWTCGSCLALLIPGRAAALPASSAPEPVTPVDEALKQARDENQFTANWLTDLFAAVDTEVDPAVQLKLMQACGRGCFQRHQFKQDLAAAGRGDVDKLVAAYRKNFRIEREGDLVHIRYGDHCFCPAARNRPARPHDLHCECTRFTHEAIFEAALGRHVPVELVESVRRGCATCHLIAHLS
ncbi:MAG TPA: hypothetical protein VG936_01860 [Lacunisphaera sp.]|nr:hypothetical protein [Lacunisphaera sp.]